MSARAVPTRPHSYAGDPAVRSAFLTLVRSPRTAFTLVYLSRDAAIARARTAHRRGWTAVVRQVDAVSVDGSSLDPRDVAEPDVEDEAPLPARRRRRTRRGQLLAAEASTVADPVDLADHDRHHDDDVVDLEEVTR